MIYAYRPDGPALGRLPPDADLDQAHWIDLFAPDADEIARVTALGAPVPTLEDMEEIEISNRIYREGDVEVMTIVIPGRDAEGGQIAGPVAFLLTPDRLVTVRHHSPRPFDTFASRAGQSSAGCGTHNRIFLGLIEEIISRLADILEEIGRSLDQSVRKLFGPERMRSDQLSPTLRAVGREGEVLARVRQGLLTTDRALTTYGVTIAQRDGGKLTRVLNAHLKDLNSLTVQADFLNSQITHTTDVTLGMINLEQNRTISIISVAAVIFLPPTLVASIYGMNFEWMPGLAWDNGFYLAAGLMLGSAILSYLFFKWKGWL